MKSAENIQELIQLLSKSPKTHYNSILNSFDFDTVDFQPYSSWSPTKYTRNCLYKDAQFELLLLCWEVGQETSIHNHDGEDCWVYLIEGEMEELFYLLNASNAVTKVKSQSISPRQLSFINDRVGLHKLRNTNEGKTLSLHLYAKPIEQCSFYCEQSERFIEKKLKYDTHNEVVSEVKADLL